MSSLVVFIHLSCCTLQTGNTLGACAGIIGPIIVSACTESLEEGSLVFVPVCIESLLYIVDI